MGEAGESRPGEYATRDLRLYAEYGILDNFTAYGSYTWKRVRLEEPATIYETWGGGDLVLAGRYRLNRGTSPVSAAGEVKFPAGYDIEEQPALGSGEIDFTARLLAGHSGSYGYMTADLGYTIRGGAYPNDWHASFEIGRSILHRVYGRTLLRYLSSTGDDEGAASALAFDPALVNPTTLHGDIVVGYELIRSVALEAGISHTLDGEEALAGTTFELSLAGRFGGTP